MKGLIIVSSMNNLDDIIERMENRILDFNYMINSESKDSQKVYTWKYARNELEMILKQLKRLNME